MKQACFGSGTLLIRTSDIWSPFTLDALARTEKLQTYSRQINKMADAELALIYSFNSTERLKNADG
jgi:hypothetical protein